MIGGTRHAQGTGRRRSISAPLLSISFGCGKRSLRLRMCASVTQSWRSAAASADPTDVDDSPLNLEFDERDYDANPLKPESTDQWAPSHCSPPAASRSERLDEFERVRTGGLP